MSASNSTVSTQGMQNGVRGIVEGKFCIARTNRSRNLRALTGRTRAKTTISSHIMAQGSVETIRDHRRPPKRYRNKQTHLLHSGSRPGSNNDIHSLITRRSMNVFTPGSPGNLKGMSHDGWVAMATWMIYNYKSRAVLLLIFSAI